MEGIGSSGDSGEKSDSESRETLLAVTRRLLQPGSTFELAEELVLGQRMQVFRSRQRSFRELLDRSRDFGDSEFLVFEGGPRVTFRQFHESVMAAAEVLRTDLGLSKGDRLAICARNGPAWIFTACGALTMGVVVVAFNSWWTTEELRAALELTDPSAVVVDAPRRSLLPDDWANRAVMDDAFAERVRVSTESGAVRPELPEVDEDDPAVLFFTSGTSGRPKAAILTHRCVLGFVQLTAFIGARSRLLMGTPQGGSQVVRLAVFPLFHISGLGSFLGALAFGNKCVWPAGRFEADRIVELSEKEGITIWGGASTHVARLLESSRLDSFDGTQIRQVGIGGSASTPNLIARTEERLPHLKDTFSSGYGMTESGGLVSYAPNFLLKMDADCVGPPLPTIEVRIEREDGSPATNGEVGVICVRSPIVMEKYWGVAPSDEAGITEERWLRTEDYGRLENGLLFVASRIRDLIIRGGENVYPSEVERCLETHPDVVESAVFGRDDDEFGQIVMAAVCVRPSATVSAAQLRAHCADRLAYFKIPDSVVIRPTPLPRNATGKILKRNLETETAVAWAETDRIASLDSE